MHVPGHDVDALAQAALRHGVVLAPGSLFSAEGHATSYIRVPLALPATRMTEAIRRLATAVTAVTAVTAM
jgi:DNA-binding transcriptional MocR family regulator